jgi:starch phosphorylase
MNLVVGDNITLQVKVTLGEIKPDDIQVEIYYGLLNEHDELLEKDWVPMKVVNNLSNGVYVYEGNVNFKKKGDYGYTVRVIPYHVNLPHKHDAGLITWLQ